MRDNPRRRLSAGSRPTPITIKAKTDAKDTTTGEFTQSYAPLDPIRPIRLASVEPLGGRELEYARQVTADVTHRVRLPWDRVMAEANPTCTISLDTRTLQILSVRNVEERNLTLEMMCRETV